MTLSLFLMRLGGRLWTVPFAEDSSVEAVEVFGAGFAAGVQWHADEGHADGHLFIALVEPAQGHAKVRGARPSAQLT